MISKDPVLHSNEKAIKISKVLALMMRILDKRGRWCTHEKVRISIWGWLQLLSDDSGGAKYSIFILTELQGHGLAYQNGVLLERMLGSTLHY